MALLPFGSCGKAKEEGGDVGEESTPRWVRSLAAESPLWLDAHVPEMVDPGFTLVLHQRRRPVLLDMDGSVVHYWPRVRGSGRAQLLPTGHLLLKTADGDMAEYDWEGRQTWRFPSPERGFFHHDFALLRNGNYLLLFYDPRRSSDGLLEIDRSGREVWRWESKDHIGEDFKGRGRNQTHINSVQELPPNRWHDGGHEEFRPGNILISARNLSAIYIISRPSGQAVWKYDDGLDYQHEARMAPPGFPGEGNIFLFNNRYHSMDDSPQSLLEELSPVTRSVVWRYGPPGFFSSTGGVQQCLANGNLLVTSTRGGRVFEVTKEGRIVWQWSPPYLPMRASRYEPDYCPQLATLAPPSERAVWRRDPHRSVDHEVYQFPPKASREVTRDGKTVSLLRSPSPGCRTLILPDNAELHLGYGLDHESPGQRPAADEGRFRVTIRGQETGQSETLLERTVQGDAAGGESQGLALRREVIPLAHYSLQPVELCLTVTGRSGTEPPVGFVWQTPAITAARRPSTDAPPIDEGARASAHQVEQLKALGYVE